MPPRIPLAAALRQPSSTFFKSQTAQLSTSLPLRSLRHDVPSPASTSTSTSTSTPTSTTAAILGMASSSSSSPPPPKDPTREASTLFGRITASAGASGAGKRFQRGGPGAGAGRGQQQHQHQQVDKDLSSNHAHDDYARQMTRRWAAGDVYAPHDLSPSEMGKWRRNHARKQDLVDLLGLRPLDMYRNFSVISEFMTPHGRIKRAVDTGLRPVNQRKMAKAIRRAIGLGLHPSVHHHPEILSRDTVRRGEQNQPSQYQHRV